MAEDKKSSIKKGTKSTTKRATEKTKSTKSTAKKTSAAKPGSKTSVKQRPKIKKEGSVKQISETKISDASREKSFLVDAAENIDAGAKLVKDRTAEIASDLAEKASSLKDALFHKVKKGVFEAYEVGSKAIEELTETAQVYAEKYKHKIEINKLKSKQNQLYSQLGSLIFDKYKVAGIPAEKLFKETDIQNIIKEIEKTAIEIVNLGKALDKFDKK